MSAGEIVWRTHNCLRDVVDRAYFPLLRRQVRRRFRNGQTKPVASQVMCPSLVTWKTDANTPIDTPLRSGEQDALIAEGNELLANRIRLFGDQVVDAGSDIDWNRDYGLSRSAPMRFSPAIDYRRVEVAGDCKRIWELNRHHHLVVLGRAYRVTGDARYARQVVDHLRSWLEACPFGVGLNWRSPLELAIRLINWAWALSLIRSAEVVTSELARWIETAAGLHLWEIARKFSRYSSANNHLIGEAAGAFIGGTFFHTSRHARAAADAGRDILEREVIRQTGPDGVHKELAFGYHLFVLEFFLLAGVCGRSRGRDFSDAYWRRMERMFGFVATWCEGGDDPPHIGDCDDGYVLNLGGHRNRAKALLSIGSVLFDRRAWARQSRGFEQPVLWLLGPDDLARHRSLAEKAAPGELSTVSFPDAGLYLLQCGRTDRGDAISVTFDAGWLGFGPLAAHGHADALSVTLRAYGVDFLVDAGTYDYFTDPAMRTYFRGTRAHNTLQVDGQDQSVMTGPFLWGRRAAVYGVSVEGEGSETTVRAGHNGYRRLTDPVDHYRAVSLDANRREVTLVDRITAADRHRLEINYHFADQCTVEAIAPNRYRITREAGSIELELDSHMTGSIALGGTDPVLGWVSRSYQAKRPSPTLSATYESSGSVSLTTRIVIPRRGESFEPVG